MKYVLSDGSAIPAPETAPATETTHAQTVLEMDLAARDQREQQRQERIIRPRNIPVGGWTDIFQIF